MADLVVSPVMMELQEYRALVADAEGGEEPPELSNNWFSLQVGVGLRAGGVMGSNISSKIGCSVCLAWPGWR